MTTFTHRHTAEFRRVLRAFQVIALIGLVVSLANLARLTAPNAELRLFVYISWFTIAIISAEAILHWIKTGVYALILATVSVSIIEIIDGTASIGGASLGLLIAYVLYSYVHPVWHQFD